METFDSEKYFNELIANASRKLKDLQQNGSENCSKIESIRQAATASIWENTMNDIEDDIRKSMQKKELIEELSEALRCNDFKRIEQIKSQLENMKG